MAFLLSRHAEWEMTRRGIPLALVQAVMDQPWWSKTNSRP